MSENNKSRAVWIDKHPPELPGFGPAPVKAEGTTTFYDFDGFDVTAASLEYVRLKKRFWQTKRVKRKTKEIADTLNAYHEEKVRRDNQRK